MSLSRRLVPFGVALLASLGSASAAAVTLPASAALPPGSSTTRGFVVRTAQAPEEAVVANNSIRATRQINGTLTDAGGALIPNEAIAGPETGGAFFVETLNFERDGEPVDLFDLEQNYLWTFSSVPFPGIPGVNGSTEKFALEAVGFLELAAGQYTFGVSTTSERTDFNDDDAYQVFVGQNPRDLFGLKVAEYQRIAPGFQNNWRNENRFTVVAPQAGLYPFRILYWQTGSGASLDFYTLDEATGTRLLVNDPLYDTAVKAYVDTSVADAKGPYVAEATPSAGSEGNPASAPIEALIVDGAATVETSGVRLFLNDMAVTPQTLSKADGKITVAYARIPTGRKPTMWSAWSTPTPRARCGRPRGALASSPAAAIRPRWPASGTSTTATSRRPLDPRSRILIPPSTARRAPRMTRRRLAPRPTSASPPLVARPSA